MHKQKYELRYIVQEKFWHRFSFGGLIISEQVIMYIFIFRSSLTPNRIIIESSNHCVDFDVKLFILVTSIIFVIGHLLEMIIHVFLNPFAKFRPRYELKKYALYVLMFCLTMVCSGCLIQFLYKHYEGMDKYKNMFVPFMTTLIMLCVTILTFNVDCYINIMYDCLKNLTTFKSRSNVVSDNF